MVHRHITPEQFHEYQQQWNQPVEDGDVEGQRRKQNAAYWVAYCYQHGTGGVIDDEEEDATYEEAQRILEQVVREHGSIDGDNHNDGTGKHRYLLALLVRYHDQARSRQLYRQAIPRLEVEVQDGGNDENYQEAALLLGKCLFFGHGVDIDHLQGIHWWKKATEQGHAEAQSHIQTFCLREPFLAETVSWLQQVADQGNNPWAQFRLGRCHEHGIGVKHDFVQAVEWYNKASAQGDVHATSRRQTLLRCLSPEERSSTMGCVVRNQNIEKANRLVQQSFVGEVPLSLWPHALVSFQRQENPPWEAPSPTFLSLKDAIILQLQLPLSNKIQKKKKGSYMILQSGLSKKKQQRKKTLGGPVW